MLILGLLLLAATAAFTGLVLADNLSGGPDYSVTVLGHHIATMNSLEIFCAGLALALIFGLGLMMAFAGGLLHRRKSRKLSAARRSADDAARERDALAAELHRNDAEAPAAADWDAFDKGRIDREPSGRERESAATRYADPDASGAFGTSDAADTSDTPVGAAPRQHRHARHLFGH